MNISENVSFLKGLLEGLELETDRKETKIIKSIIEVLGEIGDEIYNLESGYDDLSEQIDAIDDDLSLLEEDFYEEYDDEYIDEKDDDVVFEVTCPTCNKTICLSEAMLWEGEMDCPNCGEKLEFDFDNIKMDDSCGCCECESKENNIDKSEEN